MNRTGGGGMLGGDPVAGALSDPAKRKVAAQILGQAYVVAHVLVVKNHGAVEKIADAVLEKKELFGDELLDLLNSVGIRIPELDFNDEATWPPPFFAVSMGRRRPGQQQHRHEHNGTEHHRPPRIARTRRRVNAVTPLR
jgi:hypothetical protein